MRAVNITVGEVTLHCALRQTATAEEIWNACPFTSTAQIWGKEVYFSVPVEAVHEHDARDVVTPGEIAFWIEGSSIAIAWGRTPASHGNEPRLVAPVNIWAQTADDVTVLERVSAGAEVKVEAAG